MLLWKLQIMSGPCKSRVLLYDCDGIETCLMAYLSDYSVEQTTERPYSLETMKIRLPFDKASLLARRVLVDEKEFQVTGTQGFPSADRTVMTVARASLDNCNTKSAALYEMEEVDGCASDMESHYVDRVSVLAVHRTSETIQQYDSKQFNQQWRMYVSHDVAARLTPNHYFEIEGVKYKVRDVSNVGAVGVMPHADCEANNWNMA